MHVGGKELVNAWNRVGVWGECKGRGPFSILELHCSESRFPERDSDGSAPAQQPRSRAKAEGGSPGGTIQGAIGRGGGECWSLESKKGKGICPLGWEGLGSEKRQRVVSPLATLAGEPRS